LIHYAGLIFTEVPAALAVAVALRRGRNLAAARTADVVLLGAALALLPWLNVRYAVLAVLLLLFVLTGRPNRRAVAVLLALAVAPLLMAGSWPMWRGGWNPPARFLLPVVPALALGVAASFQRGFGSASALLLGWSVWLGLAGGFEPRLVHRDRDGTAPLFRAL